MSLFFTPEYQAKHQAYCANIQAQITKLHQDYQALPPEQQQTRTGEFTEAEWLLRRKLGITGSEVASVLGLNKYKTPYKAWLDITGRNPYPFTGNEATYWGHVLEPVVAKEYSRRTGNTVIAPSIAQDNAHPFMLGSIDRLVVDSNGTPVKILEIKTAAQNYSVESTDEDGQKVKAWGDGNVYDSMGQCLSVDSQIPQSYLMQVMHYMIVTGLREADVAVLLSTSDFRIFTIKYDAVLAQSMIDGVEEFWCKHVLDDTPPAKVESDVKSIRPEPATCAEASADVATMCQELKEIKAQKKALEERESELRDKVTSAIDDKEELRFNGEVLATYKYREGRVTFDSKRFKTEHGDLYAEYSTQGNGYRTLLLK